MTDKEKLKVALEALKFIADGGCKQVGEDERYAAKVYAELTAPQMETVNEWLNIYPDGHNFSYPTREEADTNQGSDRVDCIQISYRRPVPEKEEVWEWRIDGGSTPNGFKFGEIHKTDFDYSLAGRKVEIRLKGE